MLFKFCASSRILRTRSQHGDQSCLEVIFRCNFQWNHPRNSTIHEARKVQTSEFKQAKYQGNNHKRFSAWRVATIARLQDQRRLRRNFDDTRRTHSRQMPSKTTYVIEQGEICDGYAQAAHPWTQQDPSPGVFAWRPKTSKYLCTINQWWPNQIHVDRFRHER